MKNLLVGLFYLACTNASHSQQSTSYSASLVAMWGSDTACIETFTIAGNQLFGHAIQLFPEPVYKVFNFQYQDDGSLEQFTLQFYDLKNTSTPVASSTGLPYSITMIDKNGVIHFKTVDQDGAKDWIHQAPRMDYFGGWIPVLGQWEWLSHRTAQNKIASPLKFLNYVVGVYELQMKKIDDKNIQFITDISAVPIDFTLDENARIESINGTASPWNFIIHRTEELLDIHSYARQFATKEVLGNPSPYETIEHQVADINIQISYGRPSMRGRKIFGHIVPYNVVWRAGAGAVTRISFDKDITLTDQRIPAGSYNLYALPEKDVWTLIFNKEENAWGSAHHPEYDVYRVRMNVSAVDEFVDPFTISIEEKSGNFVLSMSWEKTKAWVEIRK